MTRYYFYIENGDDSYGDSEGFEGADFAAVVREAEQVLIETARDEFPYRRDRSDLRIGVARGAGRPILMMHFDGDRPVTPPWASVEPTLH